MEFWRGYLCGIVIATIIACVTIYFNFTKKGDKKEMKNKNVNKELEKQLEKQLSELQSDLRIARNDIERLNKVVRVLEFKSLCPEGVKVLYAVFLDSKFYNALIKYIFNGEIKECQFSINKEEKVKIEKNNPFDLIFSVGKDFYKLDKRTGEKVNITEFMKGEKDNGESERD